MRHHSKIKSGDLAWSKLKILVFSQDEAFRFLVRATFRKLGVADVLSTGQIEDAEHLASHAPDIAVVDIEGSGAEALGFLSRLKSAPRNPNPEMPVLVAARGGTGGVSAEMLRMEIAGVIPKPVSSHELTLRVAQTLSGIQTAGRAASAAPAAPAVPAASASQSAGLKAPAPAPLAGLPVLRLISPLPAAMLAVSPPPIEAATQPAIRTASPAPHGGQIAGGKLTAEDLAAAPVKPAAARLGEGDLADLVPKAAPKKTSALAGSIVENETGRHRKAAARLAAWQEALENTGHQARTGADVAKLNVAAFVAAHRTWLQSQGAQGQRASVQGMDLAGADLARTVLANATFRDADLSDSCLAEARLDGGDFRYAKLGAADLHGANLGVSQLRHAKMRLANLEGAILRGADLSGADLRDALMGGADLKGAVMISTDLRGTDLSQVENIIQSQIDRAVTDMKTKLPPGIRRAPIDT